MGSWGWWVGCDAWQAGARLGPPWKHGRPSMLTVDGKGEKRVRRWGGAPRAVSTPLILIIPHGYARGAPHQTVAGLSFSDWRGHPRGTRGLANTAFAIGVWGHQGAPSRKPVRKAWTGCACGLELLGRGSALKGHRPRCLPRACASRQGIGGCTDLG